jgi:hypothetical protein
LPKFVKHDSKRFFHRLLHDRVDSQPPCNFPTITDNLFARLSQDQLDLGSHLRLKRLVRLILGINGGETLCAWAKAVFDPPTNLTQDDPFLADLVVGEKTAGQKGVPAMVNGKISQGGTAGARNEED